MSEVSQCGQHGDITVSSACRAACRRSGEGHVLMPSGSPLNLDFLPLVGACADRHEPHRAMSPSRTNSTTSGAPAMRLMSTAASPIMIHGKVMEVDREAATSMKMNLSPGMRHGPPVILTLCLDIQIQLSRLHNARLFMGYLIHVVSRGDGGILATMRPNRG